MIIHQIDKKEAFANPFASDIYLIKIDLDRKVMYYFPIKTLSGEVIQKESKSVNTIFCKIDWKKEGEDDEKKNNHIAQPNANLGPWECEHQLSFNENGNLDIPG